MCHWLLSICSKRYCTNEVASTWLHREQLYVLFIGIVHVIEQVRQYATMHYFGIPGHAQSIKVYMILTE